MAGPPPVRVELLGPVRVLDGEGCDVTPSGVLQRRLLALLVLHRGEQVSVDAAVEALWPSQLPADPIGALQNHVSRLRTVLPTGAVEAIADGYRLDPAAVDVDADRLAALVADPRALDEAGRADLDALLARGDVALPELVDLDDGRAEAARLAELRVRAREIRAEHRLTTGDTEGLVAELRLLADAAPLRERPRALLMAALQATGRRVEALRVYDEFRRLLSDELGIEPSPELRAQHAEVLQPSAGSSPSAVQTRLPVPATALIGRDELVDEIVELVGTCRLVTLVGPGGVGKTRLLLDIGRDLAEAGPGRPVVLCELGAADADHTAGTVAAALGIDRRPDVPAASQIARVVGDGELVLLVDNCEHVLDVVAELVEGILAVAPGMRVVATSRERLRVPGEHVRSVPVLPVEGDDPPAVRLFVERARATLAGFAPSEEDVAVIGDIVRRLDGLPLAIELAAARLHTHHLTEVAAGLDDRFALLSAGHRTATRHASLGAAVSWSVDALDERLQAVFAGLSVFVSPFTVEDAAAVCDADTARTAGALAELCERSLVTRTPDRRYAVLETLQAFGAEWLLAHGLAEQVRGRHADRFVEWAARADRSLLDPGPSVIAAVDAALPELNTALRWLVDRNDASRAGRLTAALQDYAMLRLRPDVLAWAELVTGCDPDDGGPFAAQAWAAAAYGAWMAGNVAECGVRSARAVAVASDGVATAAAATIRGNFELFEGRLDAARRWYRRADEAAMAVDDVAQHLIVSATEVLALGYAGDPTASACVDALLAEVGDQATPYAAHAWYCAGEAVLATDQDRARAYFEGALDLAARTGTALVTGLAGASRASIEARVGDPAVAADNFRELIQHWRRAGMWSTQWTMLRSIAGLLTRLGRHRDAAVIVGAVQATRSGHRVFGADELALREVGEHVREALGTDAFGVALAEGARLDGEAAVEHALQAL